MGGTNTKVGLFSTGSEPLVTRTFPSRVDSEPLPDLIPTLRALLSTRDIPEADVTGIGVALPGALDPAGDLFLCPNIPLDQPALSARLRETFPGSTLRFSNDANAALLAEMAFGSAHGYDDVFMLTLGTGVGGALALNGDLIEGTHGLAGEVGHLKVAWEDARACGCGGSGCLERYVSTGGVLESARELLASDDSPSTLREQSNLRCRGVFDAAREGDRLALELVDGFADVLARGLAQLACVVDPEVFVIGGGLSCYEDVFLPHLVRVYRHEVLAPARKTPIVCAQLRNQAGIVGAMLLIASS